LGRRSGRPPLIAADAVRELRQGVTSATLGSNAPTRPALNKLLVDAMSAGPAAAAAHPEAHLFASPSSLRRYGQQVAPIKVKQTQAKTARRVEAEGDLRNAVSLAAVVPAVTRRDVADPSTELAAQHIYNHDVTTLSLTKNHATAQTLTTPEAVVALKKDNRSVASQKAKATGLGFLSVKLHATADANGRMRALHLSLAGRMKADGGKKQKKAAKGGGGRGPDAVPAVEPKLFTLPGANNGIGDTDLATFMLLPSGFQGEALAEIVFKRVWGCILSVRTDSGRAHIRYHESQSPPRKDARGAQDDGRTVFSLDGDVPGINLLLRPGVRAWLVSRGIDVLKFAAACSGLQQPLDTSPGFRAVKQFLRSIKYQYKSHLNDASPYMPAFEKWITKHTDLTGPERDLLMTFVGQLPAMLRDQMSIKNLAAGWKAAGVVPYNPAKMMRRCTKKWPTYPTSATIAKLAAQVATTGRCTNAMMDALGVPACLNVASPSDEQFELAFLNAERGVQKKKKLTLDEMHLSRQRALIVTHAGIDALREARENEMVAKEAAKAAKAKTKKQAEDEKKRKKSEREKNKLQKDAEASRKVGEKAAREAAREAAARQKASEKAAREAAAQQKAIDKENRRKARKGAATKKRWRDEAAAATKAAAQAAVSTAATDNAQQAAKRRKRGGTGAGVDQRRAQKVCADCGQQHAIWMPCAGRI
jgi:hypothetical protein